MKYLHLIWASLFRRKTRTVLTLVSIIAAFLLFGLLDAVRTSFNQAGQSANGAQRLQTGSKLSFIQTLPQSLQARMEQVPGVKTVAGIGGRLIVPLGHLHAAYVRSHFGSAELSVWDGPRRAEIVYGLAMATGARPHARIGGLRADDVVGDDGLR